MDFMAMTTISSYLSIMEQNMKWEAKKAKISDKPQMVSKTVTEGQITDETEMSDAERIARDLRKAQTLSTIHTKMLSGGNLTSGELEYLQKNNPGLYEKAKKIKQEREECKRDLFRCRSKEDVRQLHLRKMGQFFEEVKAIQNGETSGDSEAGSIETVRMRMSAVVKDHFEFVQSERYERLPEKSRIKRRFIDVNTDEEKKDKEKTYISIKTSGERTSALDFKR